MSIQELIDRLNSIPEAVLRLCLSDIDEDITLGYAIIFRDYVEYVPGAYIDCKRIGPCRKRPKVVKVFCPQKLTLITLYISFNADVICVSEEDAHYYTDNANYVKIIDI